MGDRQESAVRDELVAHVAELAAATQLPLNVDSERCYPTTAGGVVETVRLLSEAGGGGLLDRDYARLPTASTRSTAAVRRVREAVDAAHSDGEPLVLTARAENHIRGVDGRRPRAIVAVVLGAPERCWACACHQEAGRVEFAASVRVARPDA